MSDITLYRSDAPDTSIEAADGLDTTKLEGLVLKAISKFDKGCISDDIRKYCEVFHGIQSYSSITARYCSLERKGLITYTGEKRRGDSGRSQRVMILSNPKMEQANG